MNTEQAERAPLVNGLKRVHQCQMVGAPDLDIEVGHTGYLDSTKVEQMPAPVLGGVDEYGRPFVAMVVNFKFDDGYETREVIVLHQRYSDSEDVWVLAGPHSGEIAPSAIGREHLMVVEQMLDGYTVRLDECCVSIDIDG